MPYLKYPRTPHLPWSPGASSDDVFLVDTQNFVGKEVVVTEKLDGENTTLYPDHLHARSSRPHPTKAVLRKKGKVVWDATNLAGELRSKVTELGFDYHALVRLVVFQMPERCFFAGNTSREYPVRERVLKQQLDNLEFPYLHEAHQIVFVGEEIVSRNKAVVAGCKTARE